MICIALLVMAAVLPTQDAPAPPAAARTLADLYTPGAEVGWGRRRRGWRYGAEDLFRGLGNADIFGKVEMDGTWRLARGDAYRLGERFSYVAKLESGRTFG